MCDVSDMSVISRVPASKQGDVWQKQMMILRHAGGPRGGLSDRLQGNAFETFHTPGHSGTFLNF